MSSPVAVRALGAAALPFDEPQLLAKTGPAIDISRLMLPPPRRPQAPFGVLDISEYFAETSGGVRTYLMQKDRRAHV